MAVEAQNFQQSSPDLTPDPIVLAPGREMPGLYTPWAPNYPETH